MRLKNTNTNIKNKIKWKNTNKKTHSITNGISDKSPHVDFKNQFHKLILLTCLEPIVWILVGAHYAKKNAIKNEKIQSNKKIEKENA